MEKNTFSNVQIELLKMFNFNIPESQLLEIRKMLANYFAQKASDEMDELWSKGGWSDATMEDWANEHMREKK
jgi:hypothetical protein